MGVSYFITATGTAAGKTWLSAGVAAYCRAHGIKVHAVKPVMSGFDAAHADACDAAQLTAGTTTKIAAQIAEISPWRFAAPLSPDRAAALEGRAIDFDALVDWCRAQIGVERHTCDADLLLIEGIGGVMAPLTATHSVREWIAALGIPVVLIAGTYLGAISHTLTALAALAAVGSVPACIVVNASAGSEVSIEDTLASLRPHVGDIAVLTLGRDDAAGLARIAAFLLE